MAKQMLFNTYPQMTTFWTVKPVKKGINFTKRNQYWRKERVYVSKETDVRESECFTYQKKPMLEKRIVLFHQKKVYSTVQYSTVQYSTVQSVNS